MADFAVKSAISVAPGWVWGAMASTESGRIVVRMAELLMNSAIPRVGSSTTVAHDRPEGRAVLKIAMSSYGVLALLLSEQS